MKKLLIFLLFVTSLCGAQTRPNWLQITGTPMVSVTAYGAKGDGITDDTAAVNTAFTTGQPVYFPAGTYVGDFTVPNAVWGIQIHGAGPAHTILKAKTVGRAALILGHTAGAEWDYTCIKGIKFNGDSKTKNGVSYSEAEAGRVSFEQCSFSDCNIGLDRGLGNIGLSLTSCNFTRNNIGISSIGSATIGMHAGNTDVNMCQFDSNDVAAIYINDTFGGNGQFSIRNSILELNDGHDIYVANYNTISLTPLIIDNIWFEEASSVTTKQNITTPDGVVASATNLWLHNTDARLSNFRFRTLHASGSSLLFDMAAPYYAETGTNLSYSTTTNCTITHTNLPQQAGGIVDGLTLSFFEAGYVSADDTLGNLSLHKVPHRQFLTRGFSSAVYTAQEGASTSAYVDSIGQPLASATDGILFDKCIRVVATATTQIGIGYGGSQGDLDILDVGKYYVLTFDIKRNNTAAETLHSLPVVVNFASPTNAIYNSTPIKNLPSGEWVTIGGIFYVNPADPTFKRIAIGFPAHGALAPGNYNLSAIQCVGFNKMEEAHSYFLSGAYSRSSNGL